MLSNFKLKAHKYSEAIKADLKSARKYLVGGFHVPSSQILGPRKALQNDRAAMLLLLWIQVWLKIGLLRSRNHLLYPQNECRGLAGQAESVL